MNTKWMTSAMVATGGLLIAGAANAQAVTTTTTSTSPNTVTTTDDYFYYGSRGDRLPPLTDRTTTKAIEITIAPGYSQGFGHVASGQPLLNDTGTAGGALEAGLAYRFTPRFALGVYGSGARFGRGSAVESDAMVWSATAGLRADFHFAPNKTVDPWISLGTGWRGYWIDSDRAGGDLARHGVQAGRGQIGVGIRMSPQVAIAPVIGADIAMFLTEAGPGGSFGSLAGPNFNTFVFGGLMGRFDIPVATTPSQRSVASR